MKAIQIYDPPMCCSTGVCGPDVDPDLAQFSALLNRLIAAGITVERYGLGQQPMAFVQNPKVKALLEADGVEALPLIFWDSEIVSKGKYPDASERARWMQTAGGAP
jgi:Arsenical resistance operon protein ArsD